MAGNAPFTDKEMMMDSLSSQKFIADLYNNLAGESATPEVKDCVLNILNEEHEIGHTLWSDMNSRGWYPVEKADDKKLQSTKTKYQNMQ